MVYYFDSTLEYQPRKGVAPQVASPGAEHNEFLSDGIFSLRRKTLRRKSALLEEQLQKRSAILTENLSALEQDILTCTNISYLHDEDDKETKQRLFLKYKLPLYQEIRKQKSDFFKDTALLERERIDTYLQYLALLDKERMLQ